MARFMIPTLSPEGDDVGAMMANMENAIVKGFTPSANPGLSALKVDFGEGWTTWEKTEPFTDRVFDADSQTVRLFSYQGVPKIQVNEYWKDKALVASATYFL